MPDGITGRWGFANTNVLLQRFPIARKPHMHHVKRQDSKKCVHKLCN